MKKQKRSNTLLTRPPIVTVLGHVDHGKTTLLDTIRKSNQVSREFGGITQHIGAYQVEVATPEGKRKITFIDTPGHEAFSKMRSRGVSVTDLVVLVIAATEGVKPQTEESLKYIKEANVPFIVAATKMDVEEANIDRVKKHLSKIGVLTEGYGGDIVVVPVSSQKNEGIKELLGMILLLSEMTGLKGGDSDPFLGVIIESSLDSKRGALGTILVKKGIIKKGDEMYTSDGKIKIRVMFDENGKAVDIATSSKPVEVLGFKNVPEVGSIVSNEKIDFIKKVEPTHKIANNDTSSASGKKLNVILKVDTQGSLEAILGKVRDVNVIEVGVGDIGTSEIMQAKTSLAFVIGFNVKISKSAQKLAEQEGVMFKTYNIIYELLEEIEEVAELVEKGQQEKILGEGKIVAVFSTSEGKIAGIKVTFGRLAKGDRIKLVRVDKEIAIGRILNIKTGKEDVSKVEQGNECGAKLSSNLDFNTNDMLISTKVAQIKLS